MSTTLSDAMVVAMAPDEQCVGVRIFPKGYRQNGITYTQFLANGTAEAAKLQTAIERGDIEPNDNEALLHPSIIPGPPIRSGDVAVLMESKRDCMSPHTRRNEFASVVGHTSLTAPIFCLFFSAPRS